MCVCVCVCVCVSFDIAPALIGPLVVDLDDYQNCGLANVEEEARPHGRKLADACIYLPATL
jgi:hypothetical protein